MNKVSLTICTSLAALTLVAGGALAQSERMGPGGGEGGSPSMEMGPAGGSDAPAAPRADPGLDDAGPGDARGGRMINRNLRTGEPFDGGRSDDPARAGMRDRDDAATGASAGEEGRDGRDRDGRADRMDRGDRDRGDRAERRSRASDGASEGEEGRDNARDMRDTRDMRDRDARRGGRDADRASEGASEGAEGSGKPAGSLTELKGEQRSKVQGSFRSHRSEAIVDDIDIELGIGVSVPSSVVLHTVPEDVVVLVPDYRAYRYFIYEDQVVVVDPDTMEIVDILVLV